MKLRLYQSGIGTGDVVDTADAALSTDTWYRIEWNYDEGGNSEVRVDGVQVLLSAGHDGGSITDFLVGSIGSTYSDGDLTIYIDDIAINDSFGTAQTSWPGTGSIVHMQPNAAGDNNGCNAGDWQSVDEITPDDASTVCRFNDDGDILDVATEASSNAGIDSYDTVTLVQVGMREATVSGGGTAIQTKAVRAKSASGGTTVSGASTNHNDETYKTNGDADPRNYKLTSYTDPTTGIAWTPTGTNSLDEMQIGVTATDANPDISLTTLWALVEYVDGSPAVGDKMRLLLRGAKIKVSGGKIRIQSN